MRSWLLSPLLAVSFAAGAPAQSAAYTFFGNDCASSIWQPTPFTNLSLPRLGTSLQIQTVTSWLSFAAAADVVLITGVSRTTWGGIPLPFDTRVLSGVGVSFCGNLYVSGEILQVMPRGTSPVPITVSFPIPNTNSLLGARLYQQVLEHRTTSHDNEYFLTRAGEALIGL